MNVKFSAKQFQPYHQLHTSVPGNYHLLGILYSAVIFLVLAGLPVLEFLAGLLVLVFLAGLLVLVFLAGLLVLEFPAELLVLVFLAELLVLEFPAELLVLVFLAELLVLVFLAEFLVFLSAGIAIHRICVLVLQVLNVKIHLGLLRRFLVFQTEIRDSVVLE